jgi:hypothetical protein
MRCYIKLCLCQFVHGNFQHMTKLEIFNVFLLPYMRLKIGFTGTVMIHKYNTYVLQNHPQRYEKLVSY